MAIWKYTGVQVAKVEAWRGQATPWGEKYGTPISVLLAHIQHESFGQADVGGDKDAQGNPTSWGLVQFKPATANIVLTAHAELKAELGKTSITAADLRDPRINLALAAAHARDNYNVAHNYNPAQSEADKWALQFLAHMAGVGYVEAAGLALGSGLTWQATKSGYLGGAIKWKGKTPFNTVFVGKDGGPGSVDERMLTAVAYGFDVETKKEEKGRGVIPPEPLPPPATAGLPWLPLVLGALVAGYLIFRK